MDANGQRFWMLSAREQWHAQEGLEFDGERGALRLASQRIAPDWQEDQAAATLLLETTPRTVDLFETFAFVDPGGMVQAATEGEDPVPLFDPLAEGKVTSLAMGHDGVLYMAVGGAVVLIDRRDRWSPVTLRVNGFAAWRLAACPGGGVWALDRTNRKLARVSGLPLREKPSAGFAPDTVRPCQENPNPPHLTVIDRAVWPAGETIAAIASSPAGQLALVTWAQVGAQLRILQDDGALASPVTLAASRFPYSFAWISETQVAVMLAGQGRPMVEAPVYAVDARPDPAPPVGRFYPLMEATGEPFAHTLALPARYPAATGLSPLFPLSTASFAPSGRATNRMPGDGRPAGLIDSGSTQTVWHRLYLEASIPPHCGLNIWLAATNDARPPVDDSAWFPHRFGERYAAVNNGSPRGAWMRYPTELPFQKPKLCCPPERDRAGLFTALIQRSGLRVRSLEGRYLWVRADLTGDGRGTPELAALRAYGSRFSYLNKYLPELYHETIFEPEANDSGDATPSDFLERFLDNFEGVLTPLEDRVAASWLVTDPSTTPEDAIEWLASWIGVTFDPAYPTARRRDMLKAAPRLSSSRGTLRGLRLALDVATGGKVTSRDVIPVEEYRLRRTFATILGADLSDDDDPLLAGIVQSGNSYVGDTLFLGEDLNQEFLALFRPNAEITAAGEQAVEEFLLRLAHRLTVLVHKDVSDDDFKLIRRIVGLEAPAHVATQVVRASRPLIVGVASLVGLDTDPTPHHDAYPVRVNVSQLARGDLLLRPPVLDYRMEGASAGSHAPKAAIGGPQYVDYGKPFKLSGAGSTPAPGKSIEKYIWEEKE